MIERLRQAPRGTARELEVEARRGIVLSLVAALRPLVAQISELSGEITGAVRAHPDGHDHRLPNAMTTLADTSRHTKPWARRIYERAGSGQGSSARNPHPRSRVGARSVADVAGRRAL